MGRAPLQRRVPAAQAASHLLADATVLRRFGDTEFAARLPAIVCTALLVWLTFHIGARWFSGAVGFTAGFGLLTCAQTLLVGRGALADMPMVLCVLLAH